LAATGGRDALERSTFELMIVDATVPYLICAASKRSD